MSEVKYIKLRSSLISHYKNIALYYKNEHNHYILYKAADEPLSIKRVVSEKLPSLYIEKKDKANAVLAVQKEFNQQMKKNIQNNDMTKIKDNLINLVSETLSEPRSGNLGVMGETVDILIDAYAKESGVMKTLAFLSGSDYTTALHSVNVMALTLGFTFFAKMSKEESKNFGLAALFHDLGKTKIPHDLLNSNRQLTVDEFKIIKSHPVFGHNILKNAGYTNSVILRATVEHHEKLNGYGYPYGITQISDIGQLVGIIDCYEAITNDDRPYRDAMDPIKALGIIKKDVERGAFSSKFFKEFAYSLVKK